MTKSDLKRKTINGFFWGMIDSVFGQGLSILFGILLLRLLSPEQFGLVGMITIFISIAQVFVDSGLSQALIRKQNCTNTDYSTVFWANIWLGIIFFLIIWFISPAIAKFYGREELIAITRVSSITILIGSLTLIQQTILTKEVDFKSLTKISTVSSIIAGLVAISFAFTGFGVWSIVWRPIINQMVRSFLLWKHNKWIPHRMFDRKSLKDLFGFSSNILFISLIASVFKNIYYPIIGKNYSERVLGYYTNADQFSGIPSNTISSVTNKVSYPVLATLQDDNTKLKASCQKLVHTIMFISFFIMLGLALIAKPLFLILTGEKWLPLVIFFQILCIAYSITPMHIINHNILKVKGRSDLFLKTEIIKYIIFTPIVVLGIIYGLKVLILGITFFYWISFLINAMYSKKLINYSILQQLTHLSPALVLCLFSASIAWVIGFLLSNYNNILLLLAQGTIYAGVVIGLAVLFKMPAFFELKNIMLQKLSYINFIKNFKKDL